MLIIGHCGLAGTAPNNLTESIDAAIESGADMITLDARLTRDGHLVVLGDTQYIRVHEHNEPVTQLTRTELQKRMGQQSLTTLRQVLDHYFGTVLFAIELKSRGSGEALIALLEKHYIKKSSDWDTVLVSSSHATELLRIRRLAPHANLALLHDNNPFVFVAYHRFVKFTAVGFHRLHLNPLATEIAKRANIFTFVYTVDRPRAAALLEDQGIDGIVTNFPEKMSGMFRTD